MNDGTADWAGWWRPSGLVEGTRWLFLVLVLISTGLLTGPVLAGRPDVIPVILVGCAWLVAGWALRYRRRGSPILLDVGEILATTMIAVLLADPAAVLTFVFAALWFRALYGPTWRVLAFSVGIAGGLVTAVSVWSLLPGRGAAPSVEHVLFGGVPSVFLTVAVSGYLARGLFAREQAQRRDAELVRLGRGLLGCTERAEIYRRAHDCLDALCAATPGLRALIVIAQEGALRVVHHSGTFREAPVVVPAELLPAPVTATATDTRPVGSPDLLDPAVGEACAWTSVPLVEEPGWLLVGAPRRVPADAVVTLQTMDNCVALALRNSYAHEDLTSQANGDALTGLANRAAFTAALDVALTDPDHRVTLLFLDLDDFKVVNDGLGHAAGDELLRHVATRMRWAVGPGELCARLGGDEFAVLLPDTDAAAATPTAERLVELIAAPVPLSGQLAQVGASIGLASSVAAAGGTPAGQLVQQADIAMYAAKAKGKNRVQVFDPGLLREDGTATFAGELAAAADAGQLVVHYQPIVAVPDGRCTAVEALVRWQHPTRGLLGPAEFIAEAERTGSIVGIGAHVLRRACADAAGWSRRFGPLAVHVNVSAVQLADPDFPTVVRACIAEFGLGPKQLVLEITETMVLESTAIRAALDRLVEVGAAIAIDDFGTGYSALSTIRTLPLDIVKLDKSFIDGGSSHAADVAVVGAIVAMAGRLGLRIVAEGVERPEQQRFLEGIGADAVQGYLHLRPAPAEDLTAWLAERSRPAGRVGAPRAAAAAESSRRPVPS